jgi:CheY-like chemotaxis protein
LEVACFQENADGTTMKHEAILLISDQQISGSSVLAAAKETGHRVVSTSSTEAIALLFVMRCFAAVLLDHFGTEEKSFDLARNIRAICQNVPIILLSTHPIEHLPPCIDASLDSRMPLKPLTAALLRMLSFARGRHFVTTSP